MESIVLGIIIAGCWLLVAGCWLLVAGCWLRHGHRDKTLVRNRLPPCPPSIRKREYPNTPYIFVRKRGGPMTDSNVREMLKRACEIGFHHLLARKVNKRIQHCSSIPASIDLKILSISLNSQSDRTCPLA
ncbi:MAG TPA: hypothetical protein EYG51_01240 [Pseudomonadales bacterium]|nr:hypothetical protein [Pseudomonadales bacterium]